MGLFVKRNVRIDNIKLYEVVKKTKQTTSGNRRHTFLRVMCEKRAEANQFRRSSVSGYFFLKYYCDVDFLENFKDTIVFNNY